MIIGVCQIELYIPESGSLKKKRQVMKSLKDRIKNKFNVSVAEVDHQNLWQRCELGIVLATNDNQYIDSTFAHIIQMIDSDYRLEIIDHT
ncbi:MAG: DUF503 domain-containing protein, partial [Gemmatimonadota bacterium]|nr:DUF503 domain-containing protein [Gemmatimonadota bacterium]